MIDICQPKQKEGYESMVQPLWRRLRACGISPEKIRIRGCEPIANPAWQDNGGLFSRADFRFAERREGSLQGRSQGCFSGGLDKFVVFRTPALPWDV